MKKARTISRDVLACLVSKVLKVTWIQLENSTIEEGDKTDKVLERKGRREGGTERGGGGREKGMREKGERREGREGREG